MNEEKQTAEEMKKSASVSASADSVERDAPKGESKVGKNSNASASKNSAKGDSTKASADSARSGRRRLRGVVTSNRADKTVRVRIEWQIKHPLYEKIIRRSGAVAAHDVDNACQIGDAVVVEEMPRVSRTKSWQVISRKAGRETS